MGNGRLKRFFFPKVDFLKQASNSSLSYIHFPEITVEIELHRI